MAQSDVIGVFRPGERLTRFEIEARLPDMSSGTLKHNLVRCTKTKKLRTVGYVPATENGAGGWMAVYEVSEE
ncbi:MAG: hypothetical protein WBK88_07110 [Methanothrix sp.]